MPAKKRVFVQNPGNNAICYYRYSSAAQRDVSIDDQRDAAHQYAKDHGYHIIKEYEDHAISGTTLERPEFQLMMYEAKKLKPAYLIVWKTDRLSRDKYDSAFVKKQLKDCGIKIEYVAEALPEDSEAAVVFESLYEAFAQMFIEGHRKNVTRGLTGNAKKAWYNGRVILGYKGKPNEQYKIDKDTAPIVRRIFGEYADGKPLKQVCDGLNEAGLKTTKGNSFTINSLRHILTNRAYIGEYKWGETVVEDGMPRIIEDALFQQVQQRLEQNKRGGKGALRKLESADIADYWLTNHIYCQECGGTLQGISGTGKSRKLWFYYSCKNHRKHKCSLKNQRKELLEGIVEYVLDDLLQDPVVRILMADKCYAYYKSMNDDGDTFEESIKARIKEVDKQLDNFLNAIGQGIFNESTQERMKALEHQKSMLNDELIAEQNRKKMVLTEEQILKYLDTFLSKTSKEELLDYLVDKIYVSNDKLTITLHYTDDARELPYKETIEMINEKAKVFECDVELTPEQEKLLHTMIASAAYPGFGDESEDPDSF